MELSQNILISGILFMFIAFLSGSIPYGLLYGLLRGVDIRTIGSGNIGATNVTRQFGFWQGFVPILILDMLKGALPVIFFRMFVSKEADIVLFNVFEILVGIAAVLGHVFTPFLGFKGGKGVATTGGVLFVWNYIVALLCLSTFLLLFLTIMKKNVGRTSIIVAILFPIFVWFVPNTTLAFKITSLLLAVLIIFAHKKNIKDWQKDIDSKKDNSNGK